MSALSARLPHPAEFDRVRALAIAGAGVLALATLLTPWYRLDEYTPNGWDATWWARFALGAALGAIVSLRMHRDRLALGLLGAALVFVAFRAIAPPDFGFGFGGLEVGTERDWGLWVALGGGIAAFAATHALTRRAPQAGDLGYPTRE